MRYTVACCVVAIGLTGCSARQTSSLLLERYALGRMGSEPLAAKAVAWALVPASQSQEQQQIEITVTHASVEYLQQLFNNEEIFGQYAGRSPYYAEHLVFYVKVANQGEKTIHVSPSDFVLIDESGNQYSPIGLDYVLAYEDYRKPVATMTRGVLEHASPGYFGVSVPVGKWFSNKPQGQFALLKRSWLHKGDLHPGVVHDGLVAFWNPVASSQELRLLVTKIQTDFDASGVAHVALDFDFVFKSRGEPLSP